MRNQEWYAALPQLHPLDFAEFVLRLLGRDAVHGETTLGVVDEAEVLACLLDGDDVHVAGWVGWVGAHFAVDFDEALHDDCFGLAGVEGVLEAGYPFSSVFVFLSVTCKLDKTTIPISDEDDQGHAIPQFVRTWACFRRICTAQLVEQPMRWRRQPLLMLLWPSTHVCGGVSRLWDWSCLAAMRLEFRSASRNGFADSWVLATKSLALN